MHSLETEFLALARDGEIDAATAARAIALERGTLFSVAAELRIVLYSSVVAIIGGLGIVLGKNLDRIGPVAVTMGLAAIAFACYSAAARIRRRNAGVLSMSAEYVLLLGALVVSADLGWTESQFHWFGVHWGSSLLLLAALHAAAAYAFGSVLLLTLALTSLAAWFGVGMRVGDLLRVPTVSGWSVLACAAVIVGCREIQGRAGGRPGFEDVFDNYAANLGSWGALILSYGADTRAWGAALALLLGGACVAFGLRTLREAFVVYGVVYPAIVICIVVGHAMDQGTVAMTPILAMMLLTVVAAAAALMALHAWIKARR